LKLKADHNELLLVLTFGVRQATNIDIYVIHFNVKLKDKSNMLMSANVLKQITGDIQTSPLYAKDLEFLQLIPKDKMAGFILQAPEITTINVLVGSDYFW